MTNLWADLRGLDPDLANAVRQAAVHARVHAVVSDDPVSLAELPPTVLKVYAGSDLDGWASGNALVASPDEYKADLLVLPVHTGDELRRLAELGPDHVGFVRVHDQASLELACASAEGRARTVVEFTDPTKIPLEIVIAAADKSSGELVCAVSGAEEARIVLGVLEKGSEGVLFAPQDPAQVVEMNAATTDVLPPLTLQTLTVTAIDHVGLGDRVCIDTCSHFDTDEGILIGSFAHGFLLCCSETHPLPYMPTRPFRVNAGALHSYVYQGDNRTNYLSELRAGMPVLGVRVDGTVRRMAVGRAKLERRPLLQIDADGPTGEKVSLTVQDDWHVRVLGPGGAVLNVTELTPGTQVLGYLATERRHVGYPVDEF